ncbi:MAG: hypothetical protein EHM28_12160 [Spirochaetaceae bacterium]|nr:MAG: hypothetical protein EHM28_12160 [Spirochaetaceae bacterium]
MAELSFFFLSIFAILSLYHFFIWLWYKEDKINLSFIFLSLSLMAYHLSRIIFSGEPQFTIFINIGFSIAMCIVLPYFSYALGLFPEKWKWVHYIGSLIMLVIGSMLSYLIYNTGDIMLFGPVLCLSIFSYALLGNTFMMWHFFTNRMYKNKKLRFYFAGYCIVLVSVFTSGIVSGLIIPNRARLVGFLLLNVPFLVMTIVFAYSLIKDKYRARENALIDMGNPIPAGSEYAFNLMINKAENMFRDLSKDDPHELALFQLPENKRAAKTIKQQAVAVKEETGLESISKRQNEIVLMLKQGHTRKEICNKLGISMNTLKTQLGRLYEKYHVDNRIELLNVFFK